MSEFFHFTHDSPERHNSLPLTIGLTLKTADYTVNPYTKCVLDYHYDLEKYPILQILKWVGTQKSTKASDLTELASSCHNIIESHFKAIREYEFEEIRRVEFPQLPSRRNCVWITDHNGAEYWRTRLVGRDNPRLFRVRALGEMHTAHDGHLSVEPQSIQALQAAARAYWRGEKHPEKGCFEILLNGEMTILEELDISQPLLPVRFGS